MSSLSTVFTRFLMIIGNFTGRFLVGILKDLWKWQQDEELYKQENRTKSGGKSVLLPGMQVKWSNKATITQEDLLSWADLKTILRKWHRKLGKVIILSFPALHIAEKAYPIPVSLGLYTDQRFHACLQCHNRPEGDSSCFPSCRGH